MLPFFIVSIVAGFLLGLRFRVLVLVPVSLLIMVAITFVGAANGQGYSAMALTIIGAVVFLQGGYMIGCIMQVYIPARLSTSTKKHFRSARYVTERDMTYLKR